MNIPDIKGEWHLSKYPIQGYYLDFIEEGKVKRLHTKTAQEMESKIKWYLETKDLKNVLRKVGKSVEIP